MEELFVITLLSKLRVCFAHYGFQGEALGKLGLYEEALVAYNQAIRLNRYLPLVHQAKIAVLKRLGRLEEAQQASQDEPNPPEIGIGVWG